MKHLLKNIDYLFASCMTVLFMLFSTLLLQNPDGHQISLFFLSTENFFADFFNAVDMSVMRLPYSDLSDGHEAIDRQYPPLAYLIFFLFSKFVDYEHLTAFEAGFTPKGILSGFTFIIVLVVCNYALLNKAYNKKGAIGLILPLNLILSSIFLFTIERGNIILLASACSLLFILAYDHENKVIAEVALIALAVATALKGYPALFGILLLHKRKYGASIRCFIYAVALIFLPFLAFKGGFDNIPIWLDNIAKSSEVYKYRAHAFGPGSINYYLSMVVPGFAENEFAHDAVANVFKAIAVVGLIACFFLPKTWQRILLIASAIVALQTNSAQYLGLYLIIGMAFFFREEEHTPSDLIMMVLFVLMLNPLQVVLDPNPFYDAAANLNSLTFSTEEELNITTLLMGLSANVIFIWLTASSIIRAIGALKARRSGDAA